MTRFNMTTTRPRETYPQMPKRVRFLLFVAVLAIGGCHQSKQVAAQLANFTATTTYAVLIPQAKGVISNAYGPVKARVSPALALSIQFGLVKGPNYAAGLVTATTDTTGRLTKLTKLKQSCRISYNAVTGAVSRVLCTTASRRRALRVGSGHAAENSELDGDDDGTGGLEAAGGRRMELAVGRQHRRLSDCASCASFVSDALATGLQSTACGAAFPRLVPAPHAWAKGAAAAICAVSVNLGLHPISRYTNGVQACRCSCMRNQDCPSTVCYNRPKWEGYCRGFCSDGICLGRPLNDGEPCPDADDDDCFNQRCARDLYPSGPYVCCPSNRYVLEQRLNNWTGEYYCTGQAAGAACFDNAMCARNGVCIGGVCRPSQLEVGESCPERDDGDCSSGACGRISYPAGEYTCCPSGSKVAPGEYPGTEAYCAKSQEVDAPCGSNGMCTTGVCSQGVCFAHPIDVGEPCPDSESNDCVNQACGRESYPSGRHVCCPSNETVRTGYWNGTNSYIYTDYFCASIQVVGAPCEQDGMCSSGICTGGMCLAGPPQTGEACDYRNGNTTENDCLNGVCARSSYPSGDYICCPSNTSKQSIVLFDSFRDEYCTQTQDVGSPCDADEMCSSGVCSGFVCRPRKLDAGEPCDYDGENCSFFECTDCMSGRCARDSFPSGTTVCCDSDKRAWSPSFRAPYCAGIQGDGLACDSDELCSSGVCREFICQASNKTDHVGTLEPYHHKDLQVRCNPTGGEKYPFLVIAYWYYVNTYTTYGLFDLWDPRVGVSRLTFTGAFRRATTSLPASLLHVFAERL